MVKKEKKKYKISLRSRIHYWFCDFFNIVSYDEFTGLCEELDYNFKNWDKYGKSQNVFNKIVARRLNLDKNYEKFNERGDCY